MSIIGRCTGVFNNRGSFHQNVTPPSSRQVPQSRQLDEVALTPVRDTGDWVNVVKGLELRHKRCFPVPAVLDGALRSVWHYKDFVECIRKHD